MKWWPPCATCAERSGETARLHQQLAEERARYERLLDRLLQLEREGFHPPQPIPTLDATGSLPGVVMEAIQARVGDRPTASSVAEWAREALKDLSPDQVAQRIWDGVSEEVLA